MPLPAIRPVLTALPTSTTVALVLPTAVLALAVGLLDASADR